MPIVWEMEKHTAAAAKSLQSCPTLCDPMDGSQPGSPVPGILQARVLEWGAIRKIQQEPRVKPEKNGNQKPSRRSFPERRSKH